MNTSVDVVIGLQNGDEGKGKIANQFANSGLYDYILRFNGGGNAGHTIYKNNVKIVTHLVPCGVLNGIPSIIGNGCVLNIDSFFKEINYLKEFGLDTNLIKVAKNTHIVTKLHKEEDGLDEKIGTTRTGNGPAYRDKYNRTGIRAEDCSELKNFIVDMYDVIYNRSPSSFLAEGAQAYGLDIDWGNYPYVTSSHCGVGSVLLNGFNHKHIRNVIGVIKSYDTYVGKKNFEPNEEIFKKIREVGGEYGATTGRPRQCNWINLNKVKRDCEMNGVSELIVNKLDVLDTVQKWSLYRDDVKIDFMSQIDFTDYIQCYFKKLNIPTTFQSSPY